MNIFQSIHFLFTVCVIGVVLSVVYAKNPKKYQKNYILIKAVWSVLGAILVAINYISGKDDLERTVAMFTVSLGLLEGLPILLKPLFGNVDDFK